MPLKCRSIYLVQKDTSKKAAGLGFSLSSSLSHRNLVVDMDSKRTSHGDPESQCTPGKTNDVLVRSQSLTAARSRQDTVNK